MQKEIEKRLSNCTFVKTILMILIVLYHSMIFWTGNWFCDDPIYNSKFLEICTAYLKSFHTYAFVLVSGYIYYYLKIEKEKYNNFKKFVITKIKRLIVPYVFLAVLFVIPISIYFFNYNIQTVFKKYVLVTAPSHLWFLVMLFDVFVIVHFMAKVWDKNPVKGIIIAIIFFAISLVGGTLFPNIFMIWTACGYVIYFYIGFMLRKYENLFLWRIPVVFYVIVHLIIFCITNIVLNKQFIIYKVIGLGLNIVLPIIGAIMIFMLLQKVANLININNRFLCFISDKTMIVYLLHQQFIYFTIRWFNGIINPYIHTIINFLFSFSVSIVLAIILKKFKVTKFIVGEK